MPHTSCTLPFFGSLSCRRLWLRGSGLCLSLTVGLAGCSSPSQGLGAKDKGSSSDTDSDKKGSPSSQGPKSKNKKGDRGGKKKDKGSSDAGEESDEPDEPKFDLGARPKGSEPENKDKCDCEKGADLIFLLGKGGNIWRFDPAAKPDEAFEDLGNPGCEVPVGQHPFSMGVDRLAHGWMTIRSSGELYKFDTAKANSCKKTTHKPGSDGFKLFGMAFVEHPNDGVCDQLYMHSFDGTQPSESKDAGKLGVMDPETLKIKTIGPINFNGGELTGTGDGRLFAFAGKPGRLLEYDAKTGKVEKEIDLGGLDLSSSFAFAFWGGDFYFFTDSLGTIPIKSKVTKLDYTGDGSVSTYGMAPTRVSGAGVSVCAPLEEPPPR